MRVFLMEDETFVALDLAMQLEEAGHEVVGPASTLEEGMALVEEGGFDCAVVDANIRGASPRALVERLGERRVPFVYVSGYSPGDIDAALPSAEHLPKPVDIERLLGRLDALVR